MADHCAPALNRELEYGFPTIFGRGLLEEFRNFVNPPFLVVTMDDLWPIFGRHFDGADCSPYFCSSIEQADLERDAASLGSFRAIVGLGGGQALDVAKYFSWRKNLPFFQAPTALSVNAVYGQRAGVRQEGKVVYRGWAVPQAIYIDYDVLAACPPALNWSGIGDVLCFHTGVLDWRYAEREGKVEAKWRYDEFLARRSLAKVRTIVENVDNIRAMNDRGINALVDGLKWGTSYHGAGWCPRHIEGTDHFLFYTLENLTGKKFLHGQPVGLGVIVGSMLHEDGAEEMLDTIASIGLDIRPEAMGLTWNQFEDGLRAMRSYVNEVGLWHSIAHDAAISRGFIADLKRRLANAYIHRS
ncbi:MAG: iron-containing alcohol dehydrogenase [Albidovulum sp.]|nr:iron-containing alcohol dehydrogenase [Albidovulum sp.]MDE0530793.1 iron-containing alcohol dehydrogenase [Albidovulum sp.]